MNNQKYGTLFETAQGSYYYFDAGTGKVIKCDEIEKELIEKILNNKIHISEACELNEKFCKFIEKENLFKDYNWSFCLPSKSEFKRSIQGSCEQIVLELTEDCNLRCDYCIYNSHHPNFRGFSKEKMSFEVAKKSIDYILKNLKKKEIALTFYGGEPLIHFKLMKECIEYTKNIYPEFEISYGFTTNLTLLTEEMVTYFSKIKNIDIVCSLDGNKYMHDKHRKYRNGKGSFSKSINNFNLLLTNFYNVNEGRNLSINCVLTPPYTEKNLKKVNNFFYCELAIPKEISCNYSYVDLGNMELEEISNGNNEGNQNSLLNLSPLEEWAGNDFIEKNGQTDYLNIIGTELYKIANRPQVENGVIEESHLLGNCIPGQKRLFVSVNGFFKTCEKVGNIPALGNYKDGYDFDNSYKIYIKEYAEHFQNECKNCWARTLCSVCYESTISGNRENPYIKNNICNTSKSIVKDMLVNYFRLYEKDNKKLKEVIDRMSIK